jgi:hopanoid biosynthesis associated protein HpnK
VSSKKFLIVTADDFGLHDAVNDAVELASRSGILTAASLMVAAPAAADAIRRARRLPHLRVGLHLVLADGRAMLDPHQVSALADADGLMDGRMFRRGIRYFALPLVRRQLEAEIRAQFSAFAGTGLRLDHVNVHKHFHLHPSLLGMLVRIGRDFGVAAVRVPQEPLWFATQAGGWRAGLAAALLRPWVGMMKTRLRAAGLRHNDQVFGIAASGAMDETALLRVIDHLPSGISEIYLHPAHAGQLVSPSMSDYRHGDELAALLSPRVRAAIKAADVASGGYADL